MPMGEAGVRDEGHAAGMRGEADTLCSAASMQALLCGLCKTGIMGRLDTMREVWGRGGIGRRSGLKIRRRKACGFESHRPYQDFCKPGTLC